MAMDTGRSSVVVISLIGLFLVTSHVKSQRLTGPGSMGHMSRLTSSMGRQQDVMISSYANSPTNRGSLSSSLLADLAGYRGQGESYSQPDSFLPGSMQSRNLVSKYGDYNSRPYGTSAGSLQRGGSYSDFLKNLDRSLALNRRPSSSGSYNRYESLRNALRANANNMGYGYGTGMSSSTSTFGGRSTDMGAGFDNGRGGSRSMSRLDFLNNNDNIRQLNNMHSSSRLRAQQGLNIQDRGSINGGGLMGGIIASAGIGQSRNPGVQQRLVQQPANAIFGLPAQTASTSFANIPTANVMSTIMQPATNVLPVLQQTGPSNLVPIMQRSVVLQQSPHVVPLVSVATQPVQTIVQTLAHSPRSLGFDGLGGLGGLFSNMGPVIVQMEDMHPRLNHHESHGNIPMGGRGGGLHRHHQAPHDPSISVVKLDEGLNIVVNYSDPYGTIMNLPVPTNEEEATLLRTVLEKAEAPEYVKNMVRIRPRTPVVVPAPVGIPTNTVSAVGGAAAGIQMVAQPVQTIVPAAPAAAGIVGHSMVGASVHAAGASATGLNAGAHQAKQAPFGTFAAYEDLSIDEIIAGAMVPPGSTGGMASVSGGSNYPVDTPHGRFVLSALDMELTQQQYAELHSPTRSVHGKRKKRKALASTRARWTGGVIPFEIQGMGFSPADHQQILNAMAQWAQSTCITFRPATAGDANKLVFREGRGCSSNVGMIGGIQYLTLQKECRIPKILIHEIGHAIGLIHEHQRDDRDNFLRINYLNIKPGTEKDFDQFKMGSIDNNLAGYDYMSIMHYGKTAFARDKKLVTMEAIDPKFTNLMGTARTLSVSDHQTVNAMYGCGGLGMGVHMLGGAPVPMAQAQAAFPLNSMTSRVATSHAQTLVAAAPHPGMMAPILHSGVAQAVTDPCVDFIRHCGVDTEIARTVMGREFFNRCSHVCRSGVKPKG